MSKVWLSILLLAMLMDSIICPPVSVKKTDEEEKDTRDDEDIVSIVVIKILKSVHA